jgi:hypothetical protein
MVRFPTSERNLAFVYPLRSLVTSK